MGAVPFDTLKLARRLEGAGFPPKQAGDTAEALAEAMSGATETDIASARTEIAALQAGFRAEIELLRRDLTTRLGSMIIVAVGVLLAAIRYPPPPR